MEQDFLLKGAYDTSEMKPYNVEMKVMKKDTTRMTFCLIDQNLAET